MESQMDSPRKACGFPQRTDLRPALRVHSLPTPGAYGWKPLRAFHTAPCRVASAARFIAKIFPTLRNRPRRNSYTTRWDAGGQAPAAGLPAGRSPLPALAGGWGLGLQQPGLAVERRVRGGCPALVPGLQPRHPGAEIRSRRGLRSTVGSRTGIPAGPLDPHALGSPVRGPRPGGGPPGPDLPGSHRGSQSGSSPVPGYCKGEASERLTELARAALGAPGERGKEGADGRSGAYGQGG